MKANTDLANFIELIGKAENDSNYVDELFNSLIINFGSNSSLIKPYINRFWNVLAEYRSELRNIEAYEFFAKGLFCFLKHDFENAKKEILQAKELFDQFEEKVLSHFSDTLIGVIYRSLGELDASLNHLEKGVMNFESDRFPKLAPIALFQLGLAYYKLRDYEQSKVFFKEALKKSISVDMKSGIVRSLLGLADLSKRDKNSVEWYEYLTRALKIIDEQNVGLALESRVISEVAMYHLDKKEYDKSLELELRGLAIKEQSDMEDQIITSLINLGKIHFSKGDFLESKACLERANKIAERIQVKFKIVDINRYLADVYEQLGMFKEALKAFKKHNQMNTELVKEKENLFYQRKNKEVKEQKELVETIHQQLKESIDHAKYIQDAMLPSIDLINNYIPNSFVFFKPKDVVSGDFYWFSVLDDGRIVLAAVDCTGHGVPGAMMSMKADALLTKVVKHNSVNTSHEILTALHTGMVEELHQRLVDNNDGMDISLCIIDSNKKTIDFSGANNPLLIVKENGEVEHIRGDRNGIGGTQNLDASFTSKNINIEKGMKFYLFSDGFQDQFGGSKYKKFMRRNFFELLSKNASKSFEEQREVLRKTLNVWMDTEQEYSRSQIDDILVIGFSL